MRTAIGLVSFIAAVLATSCTSSHAPDGSLPDPVPLTAPPFHCGTVEGIGFSAIWVPTAEGCLRLEVGSCDSSAPPSELSIIHEEGALPGLECVGPSRLYDSSDCVGLSASDPFRAIMLESGQLVARTGRDEAGDLRTSSLDAVWEREDGERIRVRTDEIGRRWGCPPR